MSRPPAQYQTQTASYQRVVNGGLIDFQDNTVRGQCEYPMYPTQIQPNYPLSASPQLQPGFPLSSSTQLTPGCIQGPPSFIHINGVTYKPVDDPTSVSSTNQSPSSQTTTVEKPVATPDPHDIERMVDTRVREKVNSYMSKFPSKNNSKVSRSMSDEDAARALSKINRDMSSNVGRNTKKSSQSNNDW